MIKPKIDLSDISKQKSGYTAGRIENIDENSLYLTDQTCSQNFTFKEISAVKEGDIVGIHFSNNNNEYIIDKIDLLTTVPLNPVREQNSAFYKLNKNGKKLFETIKKRDLFFREVRNFFYDFDFIEMHSPALVKSPGIESYIEPFVTKYYDYSGKEHDFYLPTSPEFALKEALSGGFERIFEIAKVFRNSGENSSLHKPEFFMLEWYRAYSDYEKIMDDCGELLSYLGQRFYGSIIKREGRECDISKVEKITVKKLFGEYSIDLDLYSQDEKKFKEQISSYYEEKSDESLTKDDYFFKFFLDHIEPNLGFKHPQIVYEYPFEMAILSKRCDADPKYSCRFEMYIFGIEIANAFGELTDPSIQEINFKSTLDFREINNAIIKLEMPNHFLKTLRNGLPPSAGIALGLERLFMIFENIDSIQYTNLF